MFLALSGPGGHIEKGELLALGNAAQRWRSR